VDGLSDGEADGLSDGDSDALCTTGHSSWIRRLSNQASMLGFMFPNMSELAISAFVAQSES
jgi:hypothetical protein